ncbi:hypothetical protein D1122_14285 [Cereibacter sphaeroides]|uniref:hypothetical protein n=1 Tax=Cereibacter sphaeroides TaxID=1063 RepID=UPI000E5B8409|nr:hypothetical protein [Cereibacter sphaeroides]RHZ95602.1 hypothetical protein D1122_14285 [Cereibacter sphaeroides]
MQVAPPHAAPARDRPGPARRLRVVVAGEVRAGKSSVINALLRQPVLPMLSRPGACPAFLVRHAPDEAGTVLLHHGTGATDRAPALDAATDFGGAGLCEVLVDAPHLAGIELVELPSPSNGEVGPEALALMAGADLLVWVSIASQAWRLSERSVVARLPPMRERSVIVLSRGDKLRSAADWDRIEDRVQREAGPFFGAVAFVQAARDAIRASGTDLHAWETTGGHSLAELLIARRGRLAPNPAQAEPPRARCDMDELSAALAGLVCGGIAARRGGPCLAFGPEPGRAGPLTAALRALLDGQEAVEAAAGAPVEDTVMRLGAHLLLVTRPDPSELAFLLIREDRTPLPRARAALQRIAATWAREG